MTQDPTPPPYDPLSDLPDPVIFYDYQGKPTGKTMTKEEIRKKKLALIYCGIHKPSGTEPEEKQRRRAEEFIARGYMTKWEKRLHDLRLKELEKKTSETTQ